MAGVVPDDPRLQAHLEGIAAQLGLKLDALPEGYEAQDLLDKWPLPKPDPEPAPPHPMWADEADAIEAGEAKRRPGHPRIGDPAVPWELIERLMVFGETYQAAGQTLVRYPTHAELAKRFNIDRKTVSAFAEKRQVTERRAHVEHKVEETLVQAVADTSAASILDQRQKLVGVCDLFIEKFKAALEGNRIRVDSVNDLNTIVRLREFVTGGADSRTENTHVLTLADLQAAHDEHRRRRAGELVNDLGVVAERFQPTPGGQMLILPLDEDTGPAPQHLQPDDVEDAELVDDAPDLDEAREPEPGSEEDYIRTEAVFSSNIAELGHDERRSIMEVVFHTGDVYRYDDVDRATFEALRDATSIGKAFDRFKRRHPGRKVGGR